MQAKWQAVTSLHLTRCRNTIPLRDLLATNIRENTATTVTGTVITRLEAMTITFTRNPTPKALTPLILTVVLTPTTKEITGEIFSLNRTGKHHPARQGHKLDRAIGLHL